MQASLLVTSVPEISHQLRLSGFIPNVSAMTLSTHRTGSRSGKVQFISRLLTTAYRVHGEGAVMALNVTLQTSQFTL